MSLDGSMFSQSQVKEHTWDVKKATDFKCQGIREMSKVCLRFGALGGESICTNFENGI